LFVIVAVMIALPIALFADNLSPQPSPVCPPCPCSASPSPMSLDGTRVTPDQVKKLVKEYQKAQIGEMKALEHRQKLEKRELKSAQRARLKEWEAKERVARREYFKSHAQGAERREYIKDYLGRRKGFISGFKQELAERDAAHKARRQSLKQDQEAKTREFKSSIEQGKRPPESLWPQPGH